MNVRSINKKRQRARLHHHTNRKWRNPPPLKLTYTETRPLSVSGFMKDWINALRGEQPAPESCAFENLTVQDAMKELQAVGEAVWKEFSGETSLSTEEIRDRINEFTVSQYRGLTPVIEVVDAQVDGDAMNLTLKTNDPKVARLFKMSQDQEYQDLVKRIHDHAEVTGGETYVCSEAETALIQKYIEPPVTLTLIATDTQEKVDVVVTGDISFDHDVYKG